MKKKNRDVISQSKITEQVVLAYPRTDKCIASDITGLTCPGMVDKVTSRAILTDSRFWWIFSIGTRSLSANNRGSVR